MIGPGGYGRYNDDTAHIGCPRAASDMTPCVARDGAICVADDGRCVGCCADPRDLLQTLRGEVHRRTGARVSRYDRAADKLQQLVREVTEPKG